MSSILAPTAAVQLGERLREMREALGLTQLELAEALRVTDRSIRRYEAGTTTIPSDVVLQMKQLGIDPAYLFGANASSSTTPSPAPIDEVVLREVVQWVDGEWADTGPMDEFERLSWIVREYIATVRQKRGEPDGAISTSPRRSKVA
jgi:transcriptional regulator with XRE-family HTH domain